MNIYIKALRAPFVAGSLIAAQALIMKTLIAYGILISLGLVLSRLV